MRVPRGPSNVPQSLRSGVQAIETGCQHCHGARVATHHALNAQLSNGRAIMMLWHDKYCSWCAQPRCLLPAEQVQLTNSITGTAYSTTCEPLQHRWQLGSTPPRQRKADTAVGHKAPHMHKNLHTHNQPDAGTHRRCAYKCTPHPATNTLTHPADTNCIASVAGVVQASTLWSTST
jgi:hypothetical protein